MRELNKINLNDVLFLDIETTSNVKDLVPDSPLYNAWEYKINKTGEMTQEEILTTYQDQSALYAEFGRIICVSVGMLSKEGFKLNTYNNPNEKELLIELFSMFDKLKKGTKLCGHAIKQFDIPWMYQRAIINNLKPHDLVDTSGLKPWELDWIVDTKDLFQGSSFNRASLLGIGTALGHPSPKDVISGKEVPKFYWADPVKNTPIISEYCEKDVKAVYLVLDHFKNLGVEKEVETPLVISLFQGAAYGEEEKGQLKAILSNMTSDERAKAYVILNALCSNAKGKKTTIQKKDITLIKKELK